MATLITFCFRGGVIVSGKKVLQDLGLSHYYIFSNNVSAPLPGKIKKEEELIGVVDFHFLTGYYCCECKNIHYFFTNAGMNTFLFLKSLNSDFKSLFFCAINSHSTVYNYSLFQ
ncbi:MAG: hypothetical protein U0Z17_07240 [Bacteroidales bacterium]